MPTEFSGIQVLAGLYLVVTTRWRGAVGAVKTGNVLFLGDGNFTK